MAVAVVSRGVTPFAMAMVGEIAPLYRMRPAPETTVPIEKCVAVAVPPVQGGKSMFAAGETLLPVTVQPAPDHAVQDRHLGAYGFHRIPDDSVR